MAALERYMAVLRLFTEAQGAWTVPDMATALDAPQSTLYRTVRDLLAEGLLETSAESLYRLGPAFVEFDRLTRLTDPLLRASVGVLDQVAAQAQIPCVGLLSRLYGDSVMCVADRDAGRPRFRSSYERGRPMPLTQGATSKVILARLPARRLARLLGDEAEALRAELALVRRQGFLVSRGEIDRGLAGLAAPVVCEELGLVASLTLVVDEAALDLSVERRLVLMLVSAASMIESALTSRAPSPHKEPQAEGIAQA